MSHRRERERGVYKRGRRRRREGESERRGQTGRATNRGREQVVG